VDEQQVEIRRLRETLATQRDEAKKNEEIFRRSHERFLELLQAVSLSQLFKAVTEGLRRSHDVDVVTLCVRDVQHEIRQLLAAEDPHTPPPEGVMFVETLEGFAPQYNNLWRPWLGPFVGSDHCLVFPGRTDLGSCALLPLRRGSELIGCLNFGSRDPKRFTRHHAVDLLRPLGDIAAVCLENAINRSRLVRSGITDVLTGLYNRRYLQHRLADELARARRSGVPLVCWRRARRSSARSAAPATSRSATAARSSRCCCRARNRRKRATWPNGSAARWPATSSWWPTTGRSG
jgi:two-component system, cell cycle response regulator